MTAFAQEALETYQYEHQAVFQKVARSKIVDMGRSSLTELE